MLWSLALRMAQLEVPFSLVDGACCVVVGYGLTVCMLLQLSGEGSGVPSVPLRYPMGCGVRCVVFGVYVSSPRRIAWVRNLQCAGMMLWFGAGGRHHWSLRSHYVARWGPACVFLLLCLAIFVLYSYDVYPRGRGLYLHLLPSVV